MKKLSAELFGTFALVFLAVGSMLAAALVVLPLVGLLAFATGSLEQGRRPIEAGPAGTAAMQTQARPICSARSPSICLP